MEVGSQIRENRARLSLSQDALAEKVYVSRQTISSWENGKTYPDVQSLLLLSTVFGVTVDALIKGDVGTMEKKVEDARREMAMRGLATVGAFVLLGAAMSWLLWQQDAGWGTKSAPTLVLVILAGIATVAMEARLGSLWNDLDLKTYREVLDYARGRTVRRDSETSKMARGSLSDRILHFLPYLAVIMTAGYVLGRLAKVILTMFF